MIYERTDRAYDGQQQAPARTRIGRPPIPHEHGAWVILYAPLLLGLAASPSPSFASAFALILAVTGLYLARNAAGLLLRRRGGEGIGFWLGVYLVLALAGALPLLLLFRVYALLPLGLLAAGLFALHALLLLWPARRRLDRSEWGEILAVGALSLTAPAGVAAGGGRLNATAWSLWALCVLYFTSGIFYVKMYLNAVKMRGAFGATERWRAGRASLLFHALMLIAVAALVARAGGTQSVLLAAAFAPALVRAFVGWFRLTNVLPPLKRVGILETLYALWFVACLMVLIRAG